MTIVFRPSMLNVACDLFTIPMDQFKRCNEECNQRKISSNHAVCGYQMTLVRTIGIGIVSRISSGSIA